MCSLDDLFLRVSVGILQHLLNKEVRLFQPAESTTVRPLLSMKQRQWTFLIFPSWSSKELSSSRLFFVAFRLHACGKLVFNVLIII